MLYKQLSVLLLFASNLATAHPSNLVENLQLNEAFQNLQVDTPIANSPLTSDEMPEWAEGDPKKVEEYYTAHQEGYTDRMLGSFACVMGAIVHGDIDNEQLKVLLDSFDIRKLLANGPYQSSVLSIGAQQLIYNSLQGVDRIVDIHLHNEGYDEGNYLNPRAAVQGVAEWDDYLTFMVLRYAAGMRSPIGSTQDARRRMQLYADAFPKLCGVVLPIHKAIRPDGSVDWHNTGSFLTNHSAFKTASTFKGTDSKLLPAISVHPFDLRWQEKLTAAHAKGIRLVKWMPPQSIPPDSERIDEYYRLMKQLDMALIAHAGPEHTIPTNEDNKHWADLGNPLRFRRPLQIGVNVILAHCGHKDPIPDLDDPNLPLVPGYQLFLRLAREAHQKNLSGEWSGKLYGDLAAVTTHYGPDFVRELLLCANEEGVRYIYGSDYPFTNLIQPRDDAYDSMAAANLLAPEKVAPMKEIRAWNPLLANYVFTRNLELQMPDGQKVSFSAETYSISEALLHHSD